MSSQNASLKQQLSAVSQQGSALGQQVSSLDQEVSALQQRTVQVVTVSNTIVTVETTTSVTTSTVTSVTAVPEGTLVVVGDTYDNATHTFQFTVQNTQNLTVYAQLSATFWGTDCTYYNSQGSYLSQVYTFKPTSNTNTSLNLSLGSYQSNEFCGQTPVVYLTMSYVVTSMSVSQTYTFDVVPYYSW